MQFSGLPIKPYFRDFVKPVWQIKRAFEEVLEIWLGRGEIRLSLVGCRWSLVGCRYWVAVFGGLAKDFDNLYNIFETRINEFSISSNESFGAKLRSIASFNCDVSSEAEPNAMRQNHLYSVRELLREPSAIFEGMERAARRI